MNRIAKNAYWIIGCRVGQMILSFIVSMLSARYLGPSNYGLIQYASSLVAFVTPIMQLGFTNILVNELISDPRNEGSILGTAMVSCTCSALVTMLGILLFAFLTSAGEKTAILVCVLMSFSLLFSAFEMCQYWFQAKLQSKYVSIISLISYIVVSCYKIYLLATQKSVYWFAFSYILDLMLISCSLMIIYRRLGGQKLAFSFELAKKMFGRSKHYIVAGLLVSVFAQTDRIMLYNMVDSAAAGHYSAAVTCAGLVTFVFAAIIDSFSPVILESRLKDIVLFELNMKKLYSIIIYMSFMVCIVMTLGAGLIIDITYGKDYYSAVGALRIMTWYTSFSYLGVARNVWILAEKKQKYLWVLNLSGALANVILNYLLIPSMGINGAALATLMTQFIANVAIGFVMKPVRRGHILMLQACKPRILVDAVKGLVARR